MPTSILSPALTAPAERSALRCAIVGLSTSEMRAPERIRHDPHSEPAGRELALNLTYPDAIRRAGGVPIVIPRWTRPRQRHAGDEQLAPAEQVGGSTAEQQKAAEQQRVAVDDPLQVGLAEAEVGLDRRQRDVGDRRVEHDHELREADDDEDEPGARVAG